MNHDRRPPSPKTAAILAGAMEEFLARGYAGTSMDRVAKAAGVSKATVYSHFQNKEGLFSSLVERLAKEKYAAVFNPEGDRPLTGEPSEVLRHITNNILDVAMGDRQLQAFMRATIAESGRFPVLAQAYVRHIAKPVIAAIGGYLGSRSELEIADPEATARIVVGAIVYFLILQEVMHGKEILPMERDRLVDSLVDLVCRPPGDINSI